MDKEAIKNFIASLSNNRSRTIVIVDFANVSKWNEGKVALGWEVGIPELAKLVKHFSINNQSLRRFYYGADYGPNDKSQNLIAWSEQMLRHAQFSNFTVVTKRVKYIVEAALPTGYRKKCDMDIEMSLDLIKLEKEYDRVILFSGDGDLVSTLRYLKEELGKKEFYVFASRGHIGSEVIDAEKEGLITKICYAEDFEYRLNRSHKATNNQNKRGSRPRKWWS